MVEVCRELTPEECTEINKRAFQIAQETEIDTAKMPDHVVRFVKGMVRRTNSPFAACMIAFMPFLFCVTAGAVITVPEDELFELAEPAIAYVLISMMSGSGKSQLCKILTNTSKRVEVDERREREEADIDECMSSPDPGVKTPRKRRTASSSSPSSSSNSKEEDESGFRAPKSGSLVFERK